ncbi:efflux RND transporter permease subunit [Candidatus Electrothrix sp.]|uniref:efflux RND transporter permease subunit n=1 Tax=Candidatus Electrothrix sp. TaxID=2170559 RepID=UPI004056D9B0
MSATQSRSDEGTIGWMTRNAIAANLLMVILLAGGLFFAFNMQKEVFPEFELDIVTVSVGYPGAAPSEVEQGILLPVEEAIVGVDGIREITSSAREGRGSVTVELVSGADRMKVFQDIDQAVNRIRTFPDDIEEPDVELRSRQREVMELVLYGAVDSWTLRKLGERLRDQLRANDKITQVSLGRSLDYVTHVEISGDRLREYGLTLSDVAQSIKASSEDIAAGTVETGSGEILLRMNERKQFAEEFGAIEIIPGEFGSSVTLADIATIRDGFEETGYPSRFNGQPSMQIEVFRVGNQSPLDIARAVEKEMAAFETGLPLGVQWRIDSNDGEEFRRRLSLVVENGLMAVAIVLFILALFLELRLAFWVMMGMIISFFGGILFLPAVDMSLNMITLFGFVIVLGIVVDDAIVIGENIYEHRQQDQDALSAAIRGTKEIAGPVIFSILTNIVAFIPLMLIPGETGKFWYPLPVVVVIILAVSLFEALYILPSHLGHQKQLRNSHRKGMNFFFHGLQQKFARAFTCFVNTQYRWFLDKALKYRYVTLVTAIALFAIAMNYATSAHMGMILMPEVAADEIEAGVRLPVGVTPDKAAEVANNVTEATLRMFEKYGLETTAEGVKTNVRGGMFVDVEIVMLPPDVAELTANEVIEIWRKEIGDLPGVTQITFETESGPGGWRQDISIDLSHNNIEVLAKAAKALVATADSYDNTRDVSDNYRHGKKQLDFRLLPEGRTLGLTPEYVGEQLRSSFYGALAIRLLRGTNEVEVRVKLPKEERKDIYHLEDLIIQTPDGREVPLLEVVDMQSSEAFTSINRRNGRRVVNVSMDVEPKRAVTQVIRKLNEVELPALRADYPGLTWSFEGSDAEMRRATNKLWVGYGFALFAIYALLAIAFRSYLQPLIVLSAIPFGIIGAVIGHILLGYDISLISLMGVIALSGVVVNDSLIMVHFANNKRKDTNIFDAIRQAGLRRFRPIFLTTATTFGGLTPIILETSLQAQYLIPMAISLGFGIVFSTAIILVLVPALYLILEDIKGIA